MTSVRRIAPGMVRQKQIAFALERVTLLKRIVPVMAKVTSVKRTTSGEAKVTCLESPDVWEKVIPENGAFFCGKERR